MPEPLNWRDELPDNIKGEASLANFQDIGQLAKSFVEMKAYQGSSIHIPGEDAGEDQKKAYIDKLMSSAPGLMMRPDFDNAEQSAEFYKTMGVPDKSDGYTMPDINKPDDVNISDDRINAIRGLAHELNLTKHQFDKFITKMVNDDVAEITTNSESQKNGMKELEKEWGIANKERIEAAVSIMEQTKAPANLVEAIKNGNMAADMVKWAHSLSVSIGQEGNNTGDNPPTTNTKMTPYEAKEKIQEIYDNKEHLFHKGDKSAMEHMVNLVKISSPNAPTDMNDLRSRVTFG